MADEKLHRVSWEEKPIHHCPSCECDWQARTSDPSTNKKSVEEYFYSVLEKQSQRPKTHEIRNVSFESTAVMWKEVMI